MKILKPGVVPVSTLTGRCHRCRCEVECLREEAQCGSVWDDTIKCRVTGRFRVDCPTAGCGAAIFLEEKAAGTGKLP